MKIADKKVLPLVKMALKEDIGQGDVTSKIIIPLKRKVKAVILAKERGLVCGLGVAELVFKAVDKRIRFRATASDGREVKKSRILARLDGEGVDILKAERVALNFLMHLSGIATLTNKYVQKVKSYKVKIMDTRKTTPGLRILEKYAVRCGGGINHRMGLWDQILVKDNHLCVVRKRIFKEIIEKVKQKRPKGMKVEVEVRNLHEFKEAVLAGPNIIMLDNFNIKNIKQAVRLRNEQTNKRTNEQTKLEVSGGVNLGNVRKIAETGVERISIGELTHSARALDVALKFCE